MGAITGVAFNNLLCTMVASPSGAQQLQQQQLAVPNALPGTAVTNPTHVQIEYTPIEYAGKPLVNTFTQFLVR